MYQPKVVDSSSKRHAVAVLTAALLLAYCLVSPAHATICCAPKKAETRVALVIGNSAYQHAPFTALPNPTRDAQAVASALREAGFQSVEVVIDGTQSKVRDAVRSFRDRAAEADIALVYFAGMGMRNASGAAYVFPVDAAVTSDAHIAMEGIGVSEMGRMVQSARRLTLVVIDACSDNPFSTPNPASTDTHRGLSKVVPSETLLYLYSTEPGRVASDGARDSLSPFAKAFSALLGETGLDLYGFLGKLSAEVLQATNGQQRPWIEGSVNPGQYVLNGLEVNKR